MPRRRGRVVRREVPPDPKYGSVWVQKMINHIMWKGKKSKAEKIVYKALELVRQRTGEDPVKVFEQAVRNCMPVLEVRPRRVGGATYQIPIEVRPERQLSLAMRWLRDAARARKGRPMFERLAAEILDASRGTGAAVKRRDDVHRMAEANRAFVHYRW
jgi:small subunit ribosomal protein S7